MALVELQLATSYHEEWGRDRTVWTRRVEMAFLPDVRDPQAGDDLVHLLYNEEEGEDWMDETPKRRWWKHDGTVILEFRKVIIDPPEDITFPRALHLRQWNTDRDGDLYEHLRRSGWKEWGTE